MDIRPKAKDPGKEVEGLVQAWLEEQSKARLGFAYHRYPDARAARGALAAQPADFIVGQKTQTSVKTELADNAGQHLVLQADLCRPTHLEVKDTQQERRLPKASIGQYGKLLMFHLAGFRTLVVVRRRTLGDWVCLTGEDLFSHPECPPSFSFAALTAYPNHTSLLEEYFK